MKFKYLMVGAGSANIFGCLRLLEKGVNPIDILIIEKGNSPYNFDTKNYTDQILGAGSNSDNKLIYSEHLFDLFEHIPKDIVMDIYKWHQQQILKFHPKSEDITITEPTEIPGIDNYKEGWSKAAIKQSVTWHVGTLYGREISKIIYDYLVMTGVKILTNTTVTEINKEEKTVTLSQTGNRIKFEHCIIGVGRNGKQFVDTLLQQWNIPLQMNEVHVGVRFECDFNKKIAQIMKYQYDFKLSKDYPGMNFRTFCVNHLTAEVVKEKVQQFGKNIIAYNGHAYGLHEEAKEHITNTTNFGIIASVKRNADGNEYLKKILDAVQNYDGGLKISINNPDFYSTCSGDSGGIHDLYHVFDEEYTNNLRDFIKDVCEQLEITSYNLYIPEFKNSVGEIEVTDFTVVPGIYLVGDTSQHKTRGIVPACVSGVYICDYILSLS